MRYRLAISADFEAIWAIEQACFEPSQRFSRAYLSSILSNPGSVAWIAEDSSYVCGFAVSSLQQTPGRPVAYIETIEVVADRRNQGIGAGLLLRMEESARGAGAHFVVLHVDTENASAIRLYEAMGYERKGREENFYPNRHAALIYAKPVSAH